MPLDLSQPDLDHLRQNVPLLAEALSNACFALWGNGDHKCRAAEERVREIMDELGIDWNCERTEVS